MTGKTYCCPDAASGHASAEPPSVAMNFRLPMLIAIDLTIGRHTFEVRDLFHRRLRDSSLVPAYR
jgi:hypothetical protein